MEILAYIIKTLFLDISTFYAAAKITNTKNVIDIRVIISMIVIAIVSGYIKSETNSMSSTLVQILFIGIIYTLVSKGKIEYSLIIVSISLSITYVIYIVAIIFNYILNTIYLIKNDYINMIIISIIHIIILFILFRFKRLKNGISFLKSNLKNEYFDILILNISIVIVFAFVLFTNSNNELTGSIFFIFVLLVFIMFITIQKSLQLYYKQKMLVKDLEETKVELEDKKKEVEELEKENLNFSKISHSIAHKQKSLEFKLNELSMKSEISSEIGLKDRIEKLGKELTKETISVIGKTGIEEIDDMLKYMQSECVKNKIDFQLQISGNIYTMINHYIDKEELEILLADHIKNAIIAIGYGDNINKSILVRLGKLDGYYGLYIYDSGIEFEIETLYKLGKIPATTHKDNGGTGMGFMNTFDTLRKHKASFVIEEYGKPVKNNFTKALKFIFNQKNEFKIYSYRNEEIEKENKENNLLVEKLNI